VAAAREAVQTGVPRELEKVLVGAKIWVDSPDMGRGDHAFVHGPYRVLKFKDFFPADPPGVGQRRARHLVQVWTDPGGLRTLSVGSIRFTDPRKAQR
jgi:hypothetical protein